MRVLSFLILVCMLAQAGFSQSPHGDLKGVDCSTCHNPDNWSIDTKKLNFDHSKTAFPLAGQHKNADCKSCHTTLRFPGISKNCVSCHTTIHANTISTDCQACHTPAGWGIKDVLPLHERSRFPLFGAHQTADCGQCHKNYEVRQFEPVQTDCYSCHSKDYHATAAPNHPMNKFSKDCSTCHDTRAVNWRSQNIDHSFFPLTGGHSKPGCFGCHSSASFAGLSQDCYSCHKPDYEATLNPNHVAGNFSKDCKTCHTINGWIPASFDHNLTTFPLTGRHTTVACATCHTQGYAGTPKQCVSCHQANYNATSNPNHLAAQFPVTCENCHTTNGWQPAQFDHDGPYFPIYSGKHKNKWNACGDCHTNSSNFQVFSCITCHEHNQADMNQEHQGVQGYKWESSACLSCHPSGRADGAFNHSTSQFPLTGSHLTAQCSGCHTNGYTTRPPLDCYSCHQSGFQQTTKLNHTLARFSQNCTDCHNTTTWANTTFNHAVYAGFALQNKHAGRTCVQCHATTYSGTSSLCQTCHLTDYQNAQNPNHTGAHFSEACKDCHTDAGWTPANFNHDGPYFPINSGKHKNKWNNDCRSCHEVSSNYAVFTCTSCHEHNQTDMNQEHQGVQGYIYASNACFACHPDGSSNGAFNHTTSNFPLTGSHVTLACNQCHVSGYANTPNDCFSCHQAGYNLTNKVNHTLAGFSQNCTLCHSTTAWAQTTYNHATATGFPLTGKHTTVSCASCHETTYTGTSAVCQSCHLTDYNTATIPNHATAHFPNICEDCHTTNAWKPSTFNHDSQYFPIYSGKHKNKWANDCLQCHTVAGNFATFSCIDCHEHNQASMAQEHQGIANYQWNSQRCYSCHPRGNGEPAMKIDHGSYPLSGKHASVTCAECHPGTNSQPQCLTCHQEEFATGHKMSRANTSCWECHSTFTFTVDGKVPRKLERVD